MRIERGMLDELDRFAAAEADALGRPEAIRRLVRQALDAQKRPESSL